MTDVNRASFSLEESYIKLLKDIATTTRRSMTAELRIMIDARAVALGLQPVRAIDLKGSDPYVVPREPTGRAGPPKRRHGTPRQAGPPVAANHHHTH